MSEENKLRKFKLIDKEGWLSGHSQNEVILGYYGSDEIVEGYLDSDGDLVNYSICDQTLITKFEFKYFKEIFDNQGNLPSCGIEITEEGNVLTVKLYWQENTPLEAGLIVGKKCCGEKEFTVKYAGRENVMLEDSNGEESTAPTGNLKSLIKSHKEVMFEKVLSAWKGQTLDTAFDDESSLVNLGGFFNVMYSVMKGG